MAVTAFTLSYESNKTIKVAITGTYTATSTLKLEKEVSTGVYQEISYPISLVDDSSSATATDMILVVGKFDYYDQNGHSQAEQTLIDAVLEMGTYRVTIDGVSQTITLAATDLTNIDLDDPLQATTPIATFGDSIIQIKLNYPIRNAFHTEVQGNGDVILSNFYYMKNADTAKYPLKINPDRLIGYFSEDGKTLVFEDGNIDFNAAATGTENSLYVNRKDFQQSPYTQANVLTDYSDAFRLLTDTIVAENFTVTKLTTDTAIKDDGAGNYDGVTADGRTNVSVEFNNPVLLPTASDIANYNNILAAEDAAATPLVKTPLQINSVKRSGDTFKTLDFTLNLATPLPASDEANVYVGATPPNILGALYDADNNIIRTAMQNVTGYVVQPKATTLTQEKNVIAEGTTVLLVTFDQSMNSDGTSVKAANNPANYELKAPTAATTAKKPVSAVFEPGSENKVVRLTFNELIVEQNESTLTAAATVENAIGDVIDNTANAVTIASITDTTIPKVQEIIGLKKYTDNQTGLVTAKDNAIMIKFMSKMDVTGTGNAANRANNYKFIETENNIITNPTGSPLPDATVVTSADVAAVNEDKWMVFVLPENSGYPVFEDMVIDAGSPNANYDIHIGYPGTTQADYRYVQNTAGNVYPICETQKITATVPLIDLSKGTVTLSDTNTLVYQYTDGTVLNGKTYQNQFALSTVIPGNFVIYKQNGPDCSILGTVLTPNAATLDETGTKITFEFPTEVFDSSDDYIYLATTNREGGNSNVLDVFTKSVSGNFCGQVKNDIPSELLTLSLIELSRQIAIDPITGVNLGYPIEIAATFNNIIVNVSSRDFYIGFTDGTQATPASTQNIMVTEASILQKNNANTATIILKGHLPNIGTNYDENGLFVRTSYTDPADIAFLKTKDINNNNIKPFDFTQVESLNTNAGTMTFNTAGDLDQSVLSITYNENIDFTTVPAEIATAAGLDVTGVSFVQYTAVKNFYYISFSTTTPEFGYLVLNVKDPAVSIFTSGVNDTALNVNVKTTNPDNLTFKFSKANAADSTLLNMDNLLSIEYIPSKYVLQGTNVDGNKLYANVSFEGNINVNIKN